MARSIWLVRHGQASFGKSDYDKLSELGHRQARALGAAMTDRGFRPDQVICGSMRRHRETLAEVSVSAEWELDIAVDPRWNELDHAAIIHAYKPAYRSMLLLKADMIRTFRPRAAFEDMFTAATERWARGEHDSDYVETFGQFSDRVEAAFADVVTSEAERVLVVTSVGVIAQLASGLLHGGDETTKALARVACNTGVTRIDVSRSGPKLVSFNEVGHLDPKLATTH